MGPELTLPRPQEPAIGICLASDESSFLIPLRLIFILSHLLQSRESAVGIATGYGVDDQGGEVPAPVGAKISLLHFVQTGSGVHPPSYPRGTGGSFSGSNATGE
jgi:hypothetical protein